MMSSTSTGTMVALVVLLIAGCGGAAPRTGARGERGTVEGVLVEARHYYETGAIGGDHTFCAFLSARGEIPLGVRQEDGTLILLTTQPSRLADHVAKRVRIAGKRTSDGQLLAPRSLRVENGDSWLAVEL